MGKKAVNAILTPNGAQLPLEMEEDHAVVHVPKLDIFQMFLLNYE